MKNIRVIVSFVVIFVFGLIIISSCGNERFKSSPIKYVFIATMPTKSVKLDYYVDNEVKTINNPSSLYTGTPEMMARIYGIYVDNINSNVSIPTYWELDLVAIKSDFVGMTVTIECADESVWSESYKWDHVSLYICYDDYVVMQRYYYPEPGEKLVINTAHMIAKDVVNMYDRNPDFFPPLDSMFAAPKVKSYPF